jgi:ABC-2 type transport system ATP-binding protein
MKVVQTDNLTKSFSTLKAVDSLTISVEESQVFGLLGPNGAGKTTVIKMLTTLLPPTSGGATVAGFDIIRQSRQVRQSIGYVPQLLSADGTLTGHENLLIFAKLYNVPRRERSQRILEALEVSGLEEAADRLVRTYSGGMIRRLEVAGAMLHRPKLLFLDEPTVGLDPTARKSVWERIHRLRTVEGTAVLITTHYMEEAEEHCGGLAIMHLGRVAATGSPGELRASVNGGKATMDEVFAHYTGATLDTGGSYRDTARARRTARRLA